MNAGKTRRLDGSHTGTIDSLNGSSGAIKQLADGDAGLSDSKPALRLFDDQNVTDRA